MKKIIVLGLLAIFLIAGCSQTPQEKAEETAEKAQGLIEKQNIAMQQNFVVEDAACDDTSCTVVIRNIGQIEFQGSGITAYIDDISQEISCPDEALEQGKFIECTVTPSKEISCQSDVLKIKIESGLSKSRVLMC